MHVKFLVIWISCILFASCSNFPKKLDMDRTTIAAFKHNIQIHQFKNQNLKRENGKPFINNLNMISRVIQLSQSGIKIDVENEKKYNRLSRWNIDLKSCDHDYPYEIDSQNPYIQLLLTKLGVYNYHSIEDDEYDWLTKINSKPNLSNNFYLCDPLNIKKVLDPSIVANENWLKDIECSKDKNCSMWRSLLGSSWVDERELNYKYIGDASYLPLVFVTFELKNTLPSIIKTKELDYFPIVIYETEKLFAKVKKKTKEILISAPIIRASFIKVVQENINNLKSLIPFIPGEAIINDCNDDLTNCKVMINLTENIEKLSVKIESQYIGIISFLVAHEMAHEYGPKLLKYNNISEAMIDCLAFGHIKLTNILNDQNGKQADFSIFDSMYDDILNSRSEYWISTESEYIKKSLTQRALVKNNFDSIDFKNWKQIVKSCVEIESTI